jgi:hypothetical protein
VCVLSVPIFTGNKTKILHLKNFKQVEKSPISLGHGSHISFLFDL